MKTLPYIIIFFLISGCSFIYDETETQWKDVNNSGNVEESHDNRVVSPTPVPTPPEVN